MTTQFEHFLHYSLEDLEALFSIPQEESDTLEFKSGNAEIESIFKEICALANSGGGVVIYGSPKEEDKNSKEQTRKCYREIIPTKLNYTADQMIQRIMDHISPSPMGVKVNRIHKNENSIYLIVIPKSINPPHQYNGSYLIRSGTMSTPAPPGIVEAMYNQRFPVILQHEIIIECKSKEQTLQSFECIININITNQSIYPAKDIEFVLGIVGNVRERVINKENDFERNLIGNSKILSLQYNKN